MNTKVPDIQDVSDVDRFGRNCFYVHQRDAEGNVKSVYLIRGLLGGVISTHLFKGEDRTSVTLQFEEFLQLEQGYYKPRLVEYNGSIVYVNNVGANEAHRNHAFKPSTIRFRHLHPEITEEVEVLRPDKMAMLALSTKRTPAFKAIEMLEKGEVVGCALSDNYGLITNHRSTDILIVRRDKVIGSVTDANPKLSDGYDHYYYAVNKLWR